MYSYNRYEIQLVSTNERGEKLMKLNSLLKVFISFILLLSFLPLLDKSVEASTTYKSKVNATSLNVRSKAGTNYSKVGSLKKNQVVSVSKVSKDWSYITAGKTKGWVSSKYLTYVSWKGYVNATSLNVRKTASTKGALLASLKKGTAVTVKGQSGNWGKVYISSKKSYGWLSLNYISTKPVSIAVPSTVKTYYVTASALNVRSSTSTSSSKNIIFTLKKNEAVQVTSTKGTWGKIKTKAGKTGWASLKYLTTKKPVASSPAKPSSNDDKPSPSDGTVEGDTIYLLQDSNIRKGPGTSYDIVATKKGGTALTKVSEKDDWVEVMTDDGKQGWVAAWLIGDRDSASRSIVGKVIVLDAGHGGYDPGALGKKNNEKTLTLAAVKEISSLLEKEGAKVYLTRSTDTYISLSGRVAVSHQYRADAFVSVHYNSGSKAAKGIETFYYSKSKDFALADYIRQALIDQTGLVNRGTKFGDLHVVRENNQPAALLELGFLSNPDEEAIISTKNYHKKVATAVAEGLKLYFENK